MKYDRLLPVLFCVSAFLWSMTVAGTEPVRCQGDSPYHLQGVGADKDFIYWSFTTILYKTDWTGKVVARKDVPMHDGNTDKYWVLRQSGRPERCSHAPR